MLRKRLVFVPLLVFLAVHAHGSLVPLVYAGERSGSPEQAPVDQSKLQKGDSLVAPPSLESAQAAYVGGDYATAFKEYKVLAEEGNAEAQAFLGTMYSCAMGVPRDYAKAVNWYREAAEQGNEGAQLRLGAIYLEGMHVWDKHHINPQASVERDYTEASKWFRMAAEQGERAAQADLADMYLHGEGVSRDYVQAYMWLSLAASQRVSEHSWWPGVSASQRAGVSAELNKVAAKMSPSQITEAKRLATEWKPSTKQGSNFATEIPLEKEQGVYKLPVRINGVITLKFILDSGASEVAIPADVAMTLVRTGTITDDDFLPGKIYRMANGSELKSTRLILRKMEFGGMKITDVPCAVTPPAGDLLLGQSLLERLHSWKMDNDRHVLIVDTVSRMFPDSFGIESLLKAAQHLTSQGAVIEAYARGDYGTIKTLAEQGSASAQWQWGLMNYGGHGVPQNQIEALKWFRKAAEQGNADAQEFLGNDYAQGMGVPQDSAEAVKWYLKAAEQGDRGAQIDLASVYVYGKDLGKSQDYVNAYMWLNIAGVKSSDYLLSFAAKKMTPSQIAEAQRRAGEWKRTNRYASKEAFDSVMTNHPIHNYSGCVEQCEKVRLLAAQGNTSAQYYLGSLYYSGFPHPGIRIRKNYTEAMKWFRKAADQGNANAQQELGVMYETGQGVPQDYTEAVAWYRKAAELGNEGAQCLLGLMYAKGRGVPQDLVQAYLWLNLSAVQGDTDAQQFRDNLTKKMASGQLSEAQRLARKWETKWKEK